jgi:hypothetical protein
MCNDILVALPLSNTLNLINDFVVQCLTKTINMVLRAKEAIW